MLNKLLQQMRDQAGIAAPVCETFYPDDEPSKVPPKDRKRIAALWNVWPLSVKQNRELAALELKYFGKHVHSHPVK